MRRFFQHTKRLLPHLYFAALLIWGVYVTLNFLGVDGHLVVLSREVDWKAIVQEVSSPFWRGAHVVVPAFKFLLQRLAPFTGYAIISALLYGVFVGYTILKKGKLYVECKLSALIVFLLSLFSLWLIFTTLFYSDIPNLQPQLLLEAIPAVYDNVPEETMQALKENFDTLYDRGCLIQDTTRSGRGGARVFWYSGWCMQKAFLTRVFPPLGMLMLFFLDFLVLGAALLKLIKLKPSSRLMSFIMSLGLGAAGVTVLLWGLAFFSILIKSTAWAVVLGIPIVLYRFTWDWLQRFYKEKWSLKCPFYSAALLLGWLLISYLAFNYLTVLRPFPIGWDDLGRYINNPRQMSVFGALIPGMAAPQWEFVTSLGFILFDYFSVLGATLAQQINWLAGLLAVLAVYCATKMVLGPKSGLLAALFYYTLPMIGHFSFADMKTENAIFFFGVLGFIAVLLYTFRDLEYGAEEKQDRRWLFVAGILFAIGFATKPTIILLLLMSGMIMTFAMLGNIAGFGSVFLSIVALAQAGRLSFSGIVLKVMGDFPEGVDQVITVVMLIIGLVLFLLPLITSFFGKIQRVSVKDFKEYLLSVAVFFVGFLLITSPWMIRNMVVAGDVSMEVALKVPNTITPAIGYTAEDVAYSSAPGARFLPEELAVDREHEMCKGTAREEELDRYWGYGSGVSHYLGLPWRSVMNLDSQGYYLITSPLLLLVPLLLLIPFYWKNRLFRLVFWGTLLIVAEWVCVANGIPWYGIGMFLGLAILVEALVAKAPTQAARVLASVLIAVAISTTFAFRLWQFGMQHNLYEYSWGKASYEVLREMTIPDYDDIAEDVIELSKNPERPYLYRMGTFMSYFIPRNLEIITRNDNQLIYFNCLNQEQDHQLTLRRLQALGFHSIIFDTNTATIEKDPNGTLHQKVKRFLDFANDPELNLISVVNNPAGGVAYMILPEEVPEGETEEAVSENEEAEE
jgi:hypothetical protein